MNIVYDENVKYLGEIGNILDGFGIVPSTYNLVKSSDLDYRFNEFEQIRYVESNYGDVLFNSVFIIIKTKNGNVLYTGDIADSKVIEYFIYSSSGFIDKMYIDSSYTSCSFINR